MRTALNPATVVFVLPLLMLVFSMALVEAYSLTGPAPVSP